MRDYELLERLGCVYNDGSPLVAIYEKKKEEEKEKRFNNYEKLKIYGYNGHTKILDNTPLSNNSNMTIGEYMNIEPVGLNKDQLKKYYENRKIKIDELIGISHNIKARQRKYHQKTRIKDYVNTFQNKIYYVTITFSDDKIKTDYKRKIKTIMSNYGVDFIYLTDYVPETLRIHYHGFIDANEEFVRQLYDSHHKRHHKTIWKIKEFEDLGFSSIIYLDKNDKDFDKILNYIVKYLDKDMENKELKHEIFRSRTKKVKNELGLTPRQSQAVTG